MTKSSQDYQQQYTDPDLREKLKEEIKQSDKGGNPGQWSARKSQLLKQEYEKKGGDYKGDKTPDQQNLSNWTNEEWQTKEGSAEARKADGTTKRYLPKKAWQNLSESDKQKTDQKKQQGSKQGQQHVSNTGKAKQAGSKARDNS
jgi:hypothetical protein